MTRSEFNVADRDYHDPWYNRFFKESIPGNLNPSGEQRICMEQPDLRTWIMFFVIALCALLWAVFLSAQGDMLWVSLILVIVVLGITFFKILNQISVDASKKKAQKELTDDLRRLNESGDEHSGVDDRKIR
jgi:hypothetical protein